MHFIFIRRFFKVDNFEVDNGGVLTVNSTADVIIYGDFTNNNNSDDVTINTTSFTVEGDLNNGTGAVLTGTGSITVEGVTDMRHDISAGLGIRWKHFFLDFAYVHTLRDFVYNPYSHSTTVQEVRGMSQTGQAMLTVGASIFRSPKTEQ